jgi:hypothetical protein
LNVKDRLNGALYNTGTHSTQGQWGVWSPYDNHVIGVDTTSSTLVMSQPNGSSPLTLSQLPSYSADWVR